MYTLVGWEFFLVLFWVNILGSCSRAYSGICPLLKVKLQELAICLAVLEAFFVDYLFWCTSWFHFNLQVVSLLNCDVVEEACSFSLILSFEFKLASHLEMRFMRERMQH